MQQPLSIALSIIVGSAFVALVLFMQPQSGGESLSIQRVEAARVYGDSDAPIRIVEFSDVECPFCARLHPTLETLVDESEGQISWEYRHLPLPMHRNAVLGAIATECVGDSKGNDAFWDYLDQLLLNQGNHSKDYYTRVATQYGIDQAEFESCLVDEEVAARITLDAQVAQNFGGSGTPYSVIVYEDGSTRGVSGALPLEQWRALVAR